MRGRNVYRCLIGFLFSSLAVVGCGGLINRPTPTPVPTSTPVPTPTPDAITDEEFAPLAQDACKQLRQNLNSIGGTTAIAYSESLSMQADAYREAAQALSGIDVLEAYAPQAASLQKSLADAADYYELYAGDFDEAYAKADISAGTVTIISSAAGVFVVNWAADEMVQLDIDPSIVLGLSNSLDAQDAAAEALGLEDCRKQ